MVQVVTWLRTTICVKRTLTWQCMRGGAAGDAAQLHRPRARAPASLPAHLTPAVRGGHAAPGGAEPGPEPVRRRQRMMLFRRCSHAPEHDLA